MLIWVENGKITAYNTEISKQDAEKYICDGCIWTESHMPTAEIRKGFNIVYKYENGEILAEYERAEEKEASQLDIIEANQLALMEAFAEQYENSLK